MPNRPDELNLAIDENNLLNEWKGQATMMLDYGVQLADAMQEQDEAKAKLSVVAAELESDIRASPDDYDITKVTEAAVSATIPMQPEHKVALKAVNKAKHECRVLQAIIDALQHRKTSLQGMTDLFLRQWYADPHTREQPTELRETENSGPPTKAATNRRRRKAAER